MYIDLDDDESKQANGNAGSSISTTRNNKANRGFGEHEMKLTAGRFTGIGDDRMKAKLSKHMNTDFGRPKATSNFNLPGQI